MTTVLGFDRSLEEFSEDCSVSPSIHLPVGYMEQVDAVLGDGRGRAAQIIDAQTTFTHKRRLTAILTHSPISILVKQTLAHATAELTHQIPSLPSRLRLHPSICHSGFDFTNPAQISRPRPANQQAQDTTRYHRHRRPTSQCSSKIAFSDQRRSGCTAQFW